MFTINFFSIDWSNRKQFTSFEFIFFQIWKKLIKENLKMGILEKIADIEREIARTQKNKGIDSTINLLEFIKWLSVS